MSEGAQGATVDAAALAIKNIFNGTNEPEMEQAENIEAQAEDEPDDASLEATESDEGSGVEEDQQEPVIEPPHGWTEDEKQAFKSLPADVQNIIRRRESERDSALTQRSEAVSKERKEVEALKERTNHELQRYLAVLSQAVDKPLPELPDQSLIETDPFAYTAQLGAYQRAVQEKNQAEAEFKAVSEQNQREAQARYNTFMQEEARKLNELIPELKDETKANEIKTQIAKYAVSAGYQPEQLGGASAADIAILRKAMLWDQSQQAKGRVQETLKSVPRVTKPGSVSGKPSAEQARAVDNFNRLKKSGSLQDAAAIFRNMG